MLQSWNKLTKIWASETIFLKISTLNTQEAVLKNRPQNSQKNWNWLKVISQNYSLKVFLWTLWMSFRQTCGNNSIENPKIFKKTPGKIRPFQKSSVFLKIFLWTRRCSFVKAGEKILTKSAHFPIRVQKNRWNFFFENTF